MKSLEEIIDENKKANKKVTPEITVKDPDSIIESVIISGKHIWINTKEKDSDSRTVKVFLCKFDTDITVWDTGKRPVELDTTKEIKIKTKHYDV